VGGIAGVYLSYTVGEGIKDQLEVTEHVAFDSLTTCPLTLRAWLTHTLQYVPLNIYQGEPERIT